MAHAKLRPRSARTNVAKSKRDGKSVNESRTVSESQFEAYLRAQGATFECEPIVAGKRKRPDYHVNWNSSFLIAEVKELRASRPRPKGGSWIDPYRGIRKEIHEARRQFKEYRDKCCVLVLYNVDGWEFRDRPYVVLGAMLGNAGVQIPFDPGKAILRSAGTRPAFLDGGKMVDPKHKSAQNTTISAIAVLDEFTIPNPAFEREYRRRIAQIPAVLAKDEAQERRVQTRHNPYKELPVSPGQTKRVAVFGEIARRLRFGDSFLTEVMSSGKALYP